MQVFPAYLQAGVGKPRNETINVNKDPKTQILHHKLVFELNFVDV